MERNLVKEFLGTSLRDLQAPRDLLFYLAAFSHLGIPFFEAVKRYPELLFGPDNVGMTRQKPTPILEPVPAI